MSSNDLDLLFRILVLWLWISLVATNYGFPYVFPMVDYGGHYGAMVLLWFAYGLNHTIP